MQEIEFAKISEQTFSLIIDAVESQDLEGLIDIDFYGDILHLTTSKGVFVVNKHTAVQEMWLASPISGPYHFCNILGKWKSKNGAELFSILQKELNIKFHNDLTPPICDKNNTN
jgi:iron donor protein CyaY